MQEGDREREGGGRLEHGVCDVITIPDENLLHNPGFQKGWMGWDMGHGKNRTNVE